VSIELAGRNLLFCEDRQAIYQYDDVTASIWRSIERGLDPVRIVEDLVAQGIGVEHASCTVNDVLRSGIELGLIQTATIPVTKDCLQQRLAIAGMGIDVTYSESLVKAAMPLFSHLEDSQADADHSIVLTEKDGRVSIICDGVEEVVCALPECVPALKAMLLEKLLATPGYEVALHVASLLKTDRLLLLSAQSGVGKSTLTAALLQHGFGYQTLFILVGSFHLIGFLAIVLVGGRIQPVSSHDLREIEA